MSGSREGRRRRRRLAGLLAALGAAVLVVAPATPALAHASLESSSPASGAVETTAPTELVLEFDEAVALDLGGVELTDAAGTAIDIPDARTVEGDPSTVTVTDLPDLAPGVYVVVWQVSSSDGHPARGAFTFQVGTASGGVDGEALIASALAGRGADTSVSWTLGIARFVAFAGVAVLLGAVTFHLLTGQSAARRAARALWWTAWSTAVVGSAAVFVLQGPYLNGGTLVDAFDPGLWADVAGTRLGTGVLVRLAFLALAGVLVHRQGRPAVAWETVGIGIVLTFSLTGHPSASSPAAVAVLVDAVHFAAVSLWLGGLAGLLVASPPIDQGARRFSTVATVAVPVIVVTGVWQTLNLVPDLGDLTDTTWGRSLLVKLCLVVVLVTLGGASRWLLRHDGPGAIRRLVVAELATGALVLGVTAGLVATPPTPPPVSEVFTATLAQGGLIADVSVTPGRVGGNEMHIVFSPPGGSLQPVVSVEARLRSADLPPVPVVLLDDGPNHFRGSLQIPSAGEWTLDLEVEPEENQTVLLSTDIAIPG